MKVIYPPQGTDILITYDVKNANVSNVMRALKPLKIDNPLVTGASTNAPTTVTILMRIFRRNLIEYPCRISSPVSQTIVQITPSTTSVTVPRADLYIYKLQGAGGGGAGASVYYERGGPGGGAGGFGCYASALPTSGSWSLGAGGAGGNAGSFDGYPGGDGEPTSLTIDGITFTQPGGKGGKSPSNGSGGNSGNGIPGGINTNGTSGTYEAGGGGPRYLGGNTITHSGGTFFPNLGSGGGGGASFFADGGSGGYGRADAGKDGSGGGGGGYDNSYGYAYPGEKGGDGIIQIECYNFG